MDDIGSAVVGAPHEVGHWHGPTPRAWLLRIGHGAGFGRQWELNLPAIDPASDPRLQASEPPADAVAVADDRTVPAGELRMWWLPSSRDT
jgi:hypothetical protein